MTTVSTKPYLIRAIYEWCVDQGLTPHIAVVVDERVVVPSGYAREGQIVLNLGPDATNNLAMGNEAITFQARFGGVSQNLFIPTANVLAVYARENGQGMAFEAELGSGGEDETGLDDTTQADDAATAIADEAAARETPDSTEPSPAPARRSHLKVIK